MIADDLNEAPVAWWVISVPDELFIRPKKRAPRPRRQRFDTKAAAEAQKLRLRSEGRIANVVRDRPDLKTREAQYCAQQFEPFGNFREEWKLT